MAEEIYSSGTDSLNNKRKYEDQSTPPSLSSARRSTGFSAPLSSSKSPPDSAAPPSHNNVPPPSSALDDIEAAKQRAQEIAARLFNDGEAKRPKVDNGAVYDSNDSKPYSSYDLGQKSFLSAVSSMPASYGGGHSGPSKKIEIPNGRVGVIIGKAGDTIKYLQLQSGARIQVTRDMDADPTSATRGVELTGTPEQISKAEQLIHDVLNEAETGASSLISRRIGGQAGGTEHFTMKVPNNKVGLIIGKGGETIKTMQNSSGARIQVIPLHLPPGDNSLERTLEIDGTSEQIDAAKALVNEVISENRLRNQSITGYSSHQGYQTRPPTSWATPGQQQPGYGYVQPGAYPGQTPQYNMSQSQSQSQYPGYPPQPASGGYAAGWDQSAGATNPQQTGQGGGYDYYNQQSAPQQQQAPGGASGADNTAYGYNQQGYTQQGQGYTQDGYGGYHASAQLGYGQPQPGYDQQQGYNSASGYGSGVANPTPEGQTPSYGAQADGSQALSSTQQGYNTSQQPSPNASYPSQGPTQQGYGVPPTSQPGYGTQPSAGYGPSYGAPQAQKPATGQAAYGQPQQSPTAQGGYAQPAGYATQPASGYVPPDSTAQRVPPSAYGTAPASGYAQPQYGAGLVTQPGYGGQQPPPYNSSYGSGYSQPAAYSADGAAAPASQAAPNGAVAKASPKS